MMNAMIDKFNKSGHRIFLLTGHRERKGSYKHVFERYNFSYEDESIQEVIKSIRPDLTVFMGAYDTNFDWNKQQQESVRYTAGLTNLISACSLVGSGRFVYFSSHEVYGNSYSEDVPEEEAVSPKDMKALAVAQGESICDNCEKMQGLDTLVLRFDRIYRVPDRGKSQSDPCFKMCLEALKKRKISASSRNSFSMLYMGDAVELAYKAMVQEQKSASCYHISAMEEINELQLARMISEKMGTGITVNDTTAGDGYRLILDGSRFAEEYQQTIFTHYEEGVEQVVQYMKRHSESFMTAEDMRAGWSGDIKKTLKSIFGKLLPFIENLICFIPFFMLNNQAADSEYFNRIDFYLLYVLLFAIVHGQQQALFSGLLAVAGYCFRQMYEQAGIHVLIDHSTYVWIVQIFIVGMAVGYIKDQIRNIKAQDEEELQYLREKLEDISDINDSNVRMKQNFENQIVNQKDSLGKIYEITSSLDGYGPEEVLFYAAQVLSKIMDSNDVAIYVVANRDYARLFSATSAEARKMGNSIKYTDMDEMYADLKEKRVFINKSMNEKLPLMAGAVYEEENMQLILMIWGIPWQRMSLAEANRLTIVGHLIQNAVLRASRYLESLKGQRYMKGTNLLAPEAFTLLVKAFFEARDKGLTECTLLEVDTGDISLTQAAPALGRNMRQTDYMGLLADGHLYALLSNTDEKNAGYVIERFKNSGYESRPRKGIEA